MTPSRFRWGLILILIGTLLIMARLDIVYDDFWLDLIEYFPFILIAIGIEKIFARSRLKAISYLTSILMVAGAIFVAIDSRGPTSSGSYFESSSIHYDPTEVVTESVALLELDDADLTIRSATDELLYARFSEYSFKPDQSLEVVDGRAEMTLTNRSTRRHFFGGEVVVDNEVTNDWRVSFSRDIPLSLTCVGSDNDIHLNLASNPIRELTVDATDAEIYIKLGELEPDVRVEVRGDGNILRLRLPEEVGLKIHGLSDQELTEQIGLVEEGADLVTENFAGAATRVEVTLPDEFQSLSIDFY